MTDEGMREMRLPERLEIPLTLTTSEGDVREIERLVFVRERTCKPVEIDGVMKCPECDYPLGIFSVPPFCGGCGAKVISE